MIGIGLGLGMTRGGGGGVAPALPDGALGIWYMDEYSATPVPYVPNAADPEADAPNSVIGGTRRLFSNAAYWTSTGSPTITDDSTDGATRILAVGNFGAANRTVTLPAGTFTMVTEAKSNTGSDQAFRMNLAGTLVTRTALASGYSRFVNTVTVTAGAKSISGLFSSDGVTGGDYLLKSVEIFAGSVDLGADPTVGHIVLGDTAYSSVPVFASNEVDVARAGIGGLIHFAADQTLTTFTAQAVFSATIAGTAQEAFLSRVQNSSQFTARTKRAVGGQIAPINNAQTFNLITATGGQALNPGLFDLVGKGRHVLTYRGDATKEEVFFDDVRLFIRQGGITSWVLRDLFFNNLVNGTLWGGNKYFGMALWDRALSNDELVDSVKHWEARATSKGLSITRADRIFAFEGDSIFGAYTHSVPYKFGPNASPTGVGTNFAVSGHGLSQLNSRASAVDAIIPAATSGRDFILSVLIGANDLDDSGASDAAAAAAYLATYSAYCDARRAAGWKVVVCTILPKSGVASHNARRAIVNAEIVANWVGVHCDAVADFAADPTMGPDDSFTVNPSFWLDGTHPSSTGNDILEGILRPVVNAL